MKRRETVLSCGQRHRTGRRCVGRFCFALGGGGQRGVRGLGVVDGVLGGTPGYIGIRFGKGAHRVVALEIHLRADWRNAQFLISSEQQTQARNARRALAQIQRATRPRPDLGLARNSRTKLSRDREMGEIYCYWVGNTEAALYDIAKGNRNGPAAPWEVEGR